MHTECTNAHTKSKPAKNIDVACTVRIVEKYWFNLRIHNIELTKEMEYSTQIAFPLVSPLCHPHLLARTLAKNVQNSLGNI